MNKKKSKNIKVHKNKYADQSKAGQSNEEFLQLERTKRGLTHLTEAQELSTEGFSNKKFRCTPYSSKTTIAEAYACPHYIAPDQCNHEKNGKLCTVMLGQPIYPINNPAFHR